MAENKTVATDMKTLLKGVTCTTKAKCTVEVQAKSNLLAQLHEQLTEVTIPNIAYTAKGPAGETHEGNTDNDGRITHKDVVAGDYVIDFPDIELNGVVVQTTYKGSEYARILTKPTLGDLLE